MTRGGKNHKKKGNANRVPMKGEARDRTCSICLDDFDEDGLICCSQHHGVCPSCCKQLLMPCIQSIRGNCKCCGVAWKCPVCRECAGFPNAWSVLQIILPQEEQDKAKLRAYEDFNNRD